mgnify:CR=1 FL=1
MEDQKEQDLEYLLSLSEESAPPMFERLSAEELAELKGYVSHVVELKTAGLDKLFESFSIVMKYIPNIILYKLGPKYTEPSIAAQISEKLTVKQAVSLTSGYSIDYLGEITRYMNPEWAAKLMVELKPKLADELTRYSYLHFPLKGLDIARYLPDNWLKKVAKIVDLNSLDGHIMSPSRQAVIDKLKQHKR